MKSVNTVCIHNPAKLDTEGDSVVPLKKPQKGPLSTCPSANRGVSKQTLESNEDSGSAKMTRKLGMWFSRSRHPPSSPAS